MATTYFSDHVQAGDHASRPAANAVPEGGLYSCTTHSLVYQSDGSSTWSTWATLGGGVSLGSATPEAESGAGAAGTAVAASHEDHVHPAAGGGGGVAILLDYLLGSDVSGLSCTGSAWTDFTTNQNFTVASATSIVELAVRGFAFTNSAAAVQFAVRAVIDSGGTPVYVMLGGTYDNNSSYGGNVLSGIGSVYLSGLSAATHTVKLQAWTSVTEPLYCRASGSNPPEFLGIQVIEHKN